MPRSAVLSHEAGGAYLMFIGAKALLKLVYGMRQPGIAGPVGKAGVVSTFLLPRDKSKGVWCWSGWRVSQYHCPLPWTIL